MNRTACQSKSSYFPNTDGENLDEVAGKPGRRPREDGPGYQITPRGAKLLDAARRVAELSYRSLAESVGVSSTTLHDVLNGKQMTCPNLPSICRRLHVQFYETQPLADDQIRLLNLLEKLRSHDKAAVDAALRMFASYVRGVIEEQRDNGSEHHGLSDSEPKLR